MADDRDDDHEAAHAEDHEHHGAGAPEHEVRDDRGSYDPSNKDLPSREPPLRTTAPQSEYTSRDVGVGVVVFLVGAALTFGLAMVLV